ncbi:MAG: DUF3043 domain-containing protein [Candidatus Nanopelagicales bacterium]
MTEPQQSPGKGRPTPTRAEAEAARRTKAKLPTDAKAARKAMRARAAAERNAQRMALYTGDERGLPARDQGAIRKRLRQMIDSRLSTGELFLPVAVFVMFAAFIPNKTVILLVNSVWSLLLIAVIADSLWVAMRVRQMLKREFPESARTMGHVGYAIVRSLTMRLMRLPKPRYAIGGQPRTPKIPKAYRQ